MACDRSFELNLDCQASVVPTMLSTFFKPISRTADSWYIAFSYEQECRPTIKKHDAVGVDLGVKELAILSTGITFANPKHYKQNLAIVI